MYTVPFKSFEVNYLFLLAGIRARKSYRGYGDSTGLASAGAAGFSPGRKPWVGFASRESAPEGAKEAWTLKGLTPLSGLRVYCGGPRSQGLRPGLDSRGPPGLNTKVRLSGYFQNPGVAF